MIVRRAFLLSLALAFGSTDALAGEATADGRPPVVLTAPTSPDVAVVRPYVPRIGPGLAARIRRDGEHRQQRFIAKGLSRETITRWGGTVTAEIGPIVSGVATGQSLIALAPSAIRIEAPRSHRLALNLSRKAIGADRADFGDGFDHSIRGRGALIGIYDTGLDLAHPDLREVDGPTRVEALWDQTRLGAPPPGQVSGDYCDRDELLEDRCPHVDTIGHGTLISSIAASNAPTYRGIAPDASLAVATSTTFDMFLESLTWFKEVADELEMPLVVNVSLAGQEGPHDGTSLEAQAIDAFDHMVVAAAGNEGALAVHAVARLEKGDTTNVALRFPLRRDRSDRRAVVDIWGDVGPEVSAQLQVWTSSGDILAETATITPGDPGRTEQLLWGENILGAVDLDSDDPLTVENRQGHLRLAVRLAEWEDAPDGLGYVVVRIRGEGRIDLWVDSPVSEPAPISFDRDRILEIDNQTLGDIDHTISDLATAISAVSVSAYVTRNEFLNEDGESRTVGGTLGKIAPFSSWGPTLSESTTGKKPDIAAPGHLVIGARSQSLELDDGSAVSSLYRAAAGTSIAAPHVAGAAALILSARPEMSKTDLKSFLLAGAGTDGETDPALDPRWGSGRLDVAASLELALGVDEGCGCRAAHRRRGLTTVVLLMVLLVLRPARRRPLSRRPDA